MNESHSWQPIEFAPKDGRRVALFDARTEEIDVCRYSDGDRPFVWLSRREGKRRGSTKCYEFGYFTHWQPLPEAQP